MCGETLTEPQRPVVRTTIYTRELVPHVRSRPPKMPSLIITQYNTYLYDAKLNQTRPEKKGYNVLHRFHY